MANLGTFTEADAAFEHAAASFAKSAGDLHTAYLTEMLESVGGNTDADDQEFAKVLISRLVKGGGLTSSEQKILDSVVDIFYDKSSLAESAKRLREARTRLNALAQPSPLAVALLGIGISSVAVAQKEKAAKGTATADLMGALAGANIGSKGGWLGGIIGGLVGGAGASYLAHRDQKKEQK